MPPGFWPHQPFDSALRTRYGMSGLKGIFISTGFDMRQLSLLIGIGA